jgi:hypothetical protein
MPVLEHRPTAATPRTGPQRRPRWPLVLALCCALAVIATGVVLAASGGGDKSSGPAKSGFTLAPSAEKASVPARWDALAQKMAAPWPDLQLTSGPEKDRYKDFTDRYIKGFPLTRYGEAVLGYGLVQTGLRDGDERLVDSGLTALAYVANRNPRKHHRASVFEEMAMPAAYNLVRRKIPNHPIFKRNRVAWETFLRRIRPVSTPYRRPNTRRYSNHYLVEAIGVLELMRTGLTSSRPGATLGGKRQLAKSITYRLLNQTIPQYAREDAVRTRGGTAVMISDRPDQPLAYQGFSIGYYGRALRLMGRRASPAARAALRDAVNAALLFTAPDGDSGYWGRSQEESWALSSTALGAEVAAALPGSSRSRDAKYRALGERALIRLRDAHPVGSEGIAFVPAVGVNKRLGTRGVDDNAGAPSFAGVTLVSLNWALSEMPAKPRLGRIGTDTSSVTKLSKGESRFASVRRGNVWFAVRQTRSIRRQLDLRYDFGVVALKVKTGGRWRDVMRIRPRQLTERDSAGPLLVRGRTVGLPYGTSLRTGAGGSVVIDGGFKTTRGVAMRRNVTFRIQPTPCGVRIVWPGRAGDSFVYSAFVRRQSRPRQLSPFALGDADQVIRFNSPTRVTLRGAYSSAVDPVLTRAFATMRVKSTKPQRVTICAPS